MVQIVMFYPKFLRPALRKKLGFLFSLFLDGGLFDQLLIARLFFFHGFALLAGMQVGHV